MLWDEWIGSLDGRPTLWTKHIFCRWDCHVDLHKMVSADDPGCFHTHPAHAIRLILWGGYVEERTSGKWYCYFPGGIGWVWPALGHRVAGLMNGRTSYSLWIRFRKVARIELRGPGWPDETEMEFSMGAVRIPESVSS